MNKTILVILTLISAGVVWFYWDGNSGGKKIPDTPVVNSSIHNQADKPDLKIEKNANKQASFPVAKIAQENKALLNPDIGSTAEEYSPLSEAENDKYTKQKDQSEAKIKNIMQEFDENLANPEKRAELQRDMEKQSVEYKKATLKLAKDAMKKDKQ